MSCNKTTGTDRLENQKESKASRQSQIQAHKPGKLAGQSGTQGGICGIAQLWVDTHC